MTPERFAELADAYGGDVARWPARERDAAAAFMANQPAQAAEALEAAAALDRILGVVAVPSASAPLVGRILATAPRSVPAWRRWLAPAGVGAGLAAACAAGVVVGVVVGAPPSFDGALIGDADAVLAVVSDEDFNLFLDEDAG